MPEYRIGKLKGECVLVFENDDGRRRRYRLGTTSPSEAAKLAPAVFRELTRPRGTNVADLWAAYRIEKEGRAILVTMTHTWKALKDRFGCMSGDQITIEDCRAHIKARRRAGIKDGTILTELGHLRTVLRWAEKNRLCRASYIERPPAPAPKEHHLTREQSRALIQSAAMPHIRLYIILALGTGARNAGLLDLTWDRCDFSAELIDLRSPSQTRPHKGRAVVPMNRTVRAALLEAREGAISDSVIEWAGRPVASVKRALSRLGRRVGIGHVTPHILRHSAAVHMAEASIPMSEIAQYLGHSNPRMTEKVYARFSPDYLRNAASKLEYDDLGSLNQKIASQKLAK